ncbi:hypothetical protein WMY93_003196 [Mugilogobius chulae]|uniref:Suppressor of cytokine signaling 1 n=1 Tax=Mugilogobius chulae TaxID=88201 RepID=A0AAW0PXK2_9GOBI
MVANSTLEGLHDSTHSSSSSSASSSSSSVSSSSSLCSSASLSVSPISWEDLQRVPPPAPAHRSVPCVYLTHFPVFSCKQDCDIITDTASKLERSGFYWGPLGVEEAHRLLKDAPLGSFLIRDSRQKDVFFTLSYHSKSGPASVRILYKKHKFSLSGNERSFPSLFALLEHYISSPKKSLSVPYRKWEPTLQEICRKRVLELSGGIDHISELPITTVAKDFLQEFPYKL